MELFGGQSMMTHPSSVVTNVQQSTTIDGGPSVSVTMDDSIQETHEINNSKTTDDLLAPIDVKRSVNV